MISEKKFFFYLKLTRNVLLFFFRKQEHADFIWNLFVDFITIAVSTVKILECRKNTEA